MTRWLDAQERRAWVGLLQLTGRLQAELNRQLVAGHGISLADYELLGRLHGRDGLRARDLMETLAWEQSRLSHHLGRLHKRGLVDRRDCEEDRRGAVFVLTDLGRHTIETAAPSHVEQVRRLLLDQLSPEQVQQLGDITDVGLRMLQSAGGTEGPSAARN
jgi:DNA-binding MarR family transcriptional regulator